MREDKIDRCTFLNKNQERKNNIYSGKKCDKLWWKPKYWGKKHHKIAEKQKIPKSMGLKQGKKIKEKLKLKNGCKK